MIQIPESIKRPVLVLSNGALHIIEAKLVGSRFQRVREHGIPLVRELLTSRGLLLLRVYRRRDEVATINSRHPSPPPQWRPRQESYVPPMLSPYAMALDGLVVGSSIIRRMFDAWKICYDRPTAPAPAA